MKYLFKMGAATLRYHLLGKRTPTNLMFSVTDRCNARCRYCGIPARAKRDLPTRDVLRLIDEFIELGGSRIALWGGEPLVREDIVEIIDYCKSRKLLTSLDTNGYLVPKLIDRISVLDVLVISLDGEKEVHDANREEGSFDKVIKAFEAACDRMNVWTITVLTKNNLGSIDFILEQARKYGFSTTWQLLHHQTLGSEESGDMYPSSEEYRRAIELLMKRKKEGAPIVNSMRYFKYIHDWPDYRKSYMKNRWKGLSCYAAGLYFNIDTDGKVYPCSVLVGLVPALNAVEVGLKKAFDYVKDIPCQSCTAGCFVEYNHIYSLNPMVIANWFKYVSK